MTKSLSFAIFAIIGTLTASAVGPVMADASMADALAGRFIADGDLTILPAVAPTQANAPPSYNYKEAVPDYVTVLDIAHNGAPPAALYAHLTGVWDHVMGGEFGADSHVSEGDTSIATAVLMLNLDPMPSPAGSVPMLISATGVHASASYRVVRGSSLVSGTAEFSELMITGTLLGGRTLTYSGIPPVNYLLFSNAEVSITLNEQVAKECTVTDGIQVVAVHVALTNADIAGRIVSGDFFLGEAQAGN